MAVKFETINVDALKARTETNLQDSVILFKKFP